MYLGLQSQTNWKKNHFDVQRCNLDHLLQIDVLY